MKKIIDNLTDLEKKIVHYVEEAKVVRMGQILEYIPNRDTEFIQNTVRDLVNKEIFIMKQNSIAPDWTYELSYFYKSYKNLL